MTDQTGMAVCQKYSSFTTGFDLSPSDVFFYFTKTEKTPKKLNFHLSTKARRRPVTFGI